MWLMDGISWEITFKSIREAKVEESCLTNNNLMKEIVEELHRSRSGPVRDEGRTHRAIKGHISSQVSRDVIRYSRLLRELRLGRFHGI